MRIGWNELGDLDRYPSQQSIADGLHAVYPDAGRQTNNAKTIWDFSHTMREGDIVYAKRGLHELIGRGVVRSDSYFDQGADDEEFAHVRKVEWTKPDKDAPSFSFPRKTLTNWTDYTGAIKELESCFDIEDDLDCADVGQVLPPEPYGKADFLDEVYISEKDYNTLTGLLRRKKNIVLQGPPGVGKTFCAKRLAYSIMGCCDDERIQFVQFHQSYSYEDFIMGYRPKNGAFEVAYGPFYEFCKKAADDDGNNMYFFIIDEINRGNISRIFGELFMLVEASYRGSAKVHLLYGDEEFSIPPNLCIIGTMNTADRSLAILDYALRRRFAFFALEPAFDNPTFIRKELAGRPCLEKLVRCIKDLNAEIKNDETLGSGFCIGQSYLCGVDDDQLGSVVDYEIVPMLEEYWFDNLPKAEEWADRLRKSLES